MKMASFNMGLFLLIEISTIIPPHCANMDVFYQCASFACKEQVVMKLALKVFVLVQKLEHTSVSVFGFAYVAICLIGSGVVGGVVGGGGMEMKMEFRQLREAMDHIQEKADRYGQQLMRISFQATFPSSVQITT